MGLKRERGRREEEEEKGEGKGRMEEKEAEELDSRDRPGGLDSQGQYALHSKTQQNPPFNQSIKIRPAPNRLSQIQLSKDRPN